MFQRGFDCMKSHTPERLANKDYFVTSSPFQLFVYPLQHHIPLHWHEFFELGFFISGEGSQVLNGKKSKLRRGTLFLLTPADFHELTPAKGEICHHYNLIFSDDAIRETLYPLLFHENRSLHCVMDEQQCLVIEAEFKKILEELNQGQIASNLMIQNAFERIIIEFIRETSAHNKKENNLVKPQTETDQMMHRTISFIQLHFREELTLKDAASQAKLSPNYFSHMFQSYTGIPFQNYLQNLRLQFAASLLRVSKLSVTEICFASGFNTLNHFERIFKSKFGKSSRGYREE